MKTTGNAMNQTVATYVSVSASVSYAPFAVFVIVVAGGSAYSIIYSCQPQPLTMSEKYARNMHKSITCRLCCYCHTKK